MSESINASHVDHDPMYYPNVPLNSELEYKEAADQVLKYVETKIGELENVRTRLTYEILTRQANVQTVEENRFNMLLPIAQTLYNYFRFDDTKMSARKRKSQAKKSVGRPRKSQQRKRR